MSRSFSLRGTFQSREAHSSLSPPPPSPPGVPGTRNEVFYDCCKEPYPAVTFVVAIRRRTLYYALNLLIPCVLLSSMTLLIFVLPADSGEKISLGEAPFFSAFKFRFGVAGSEFQRRRRCRG